MSEPSWQDLYDVGRAMLQSRRPKAQIEEGDVYDAILAGAASMAVAIVAYANALFKKAFLDGATGDDLTDLAHDRGVDRDVGSESVGSVTFTRVTAAIGAGSIPAGTRIATTPDSTGAFAEFVTDVAAVFAGATLSVTVAATCTEVGKIGNVAASTVNRVLDTPLFDTTITVNNAALFAGGIEEEGDEDLRDRVRGFFLTQARGTIEAIVFGAKGVPGVDRVTVTVDSAGVVTVYVADEDGNSNATLVALVETELEEWRAAGDVVYVTGGQIYLQAIGLSLTVKTGVDTNALVDRIRQAVISRLLRLNPGETLYLDAIRSAIRAVDQDSILQVTVTNPTANVTPSSNQLIRTDTGIITFT